jgi:hypothetical protein
MRRVVTIVLLLAAAVLPARAIAAIPTPVQAEQLGRQAYDYGFPLLEILRVRHEMTSVRCPDTRGNAPINSFSHAAAFARPEDRTVVAPNTDTLYSIAHIDLGKGPIVLRHPDMGKRFFDFELVDPYTNVIGYVGTRTTGSAAGRFAISWTGKPGPKPKRVDETIRSDYRRVWVIGRTLATDAADQRKAQKLMHRYRLLPPGGRKGFPSHCKPGEPAEYPTPSDGPGFIAALNSGLAANPPPRRDQPLLDQLAPLGIGSGLSVDDAGLPADVAAALYQGIEAEAAELPGRARAQLLTDSLAHGGWLTLDPRVGRYGTAYDLRALVAVVGLGANTPEEAIYPTGLADSTGQLLTGAKRYRMVFPAGQEPPARYFWSLTMYDLDGYLAPNPIDRYSVGPTHPPLVRRADGSIVIAIQHDEPTEADVNWLPAPAGSFRLNMRLYGPSKVVLSGDWAPPPVTPAGP